MQLNYLKSLNKAYQLVLEKLNKHTNIITVDATQSADAVYENVNQVINKYRSSIKENEMNYV